MRVLLDNDVIHKLARYDLLREALAALGVGAADVEALNTAKYFFGRRGASRLGAMVYERTMRFLAMRERSRPMWTRKMKRRSKVVHALIPARRSCSRSRRVIRTR